MTLFFIYERGDCSQILTLLRLLSKFAIASKSRYNNIRKRKNKKSLKIWDSAVGRKKLEQNHKNFTYKCKGKKPLVINFLNNNKYKKIFKKSSSKKSITIIKLFENFTKLILDMKLHRK